MFELCFRGQTTSTLKPLQHYMKPLKNFHHEQNKCILVLQCSVMVRNVYFIQRITSKVCWNCFVLYNAQMMINHLFCLESSGAPRARLKLSEMEEWSLFAEFKRSITGVLFSCGWTRSGNQEEWCRREQETKEDKRTQHNPKHEDNFRPFLKLLPNVAAEGFLKSPIEPAT